MAAGPLAPGWAVVDASVRAIAQHGAQAGVAAGVAAGGAALWGGSVLPARWVGKGAGSEHFWSRCACASFLFCRDASQFCFSPDVVGRLLLVAPLVAAADDEPDEEQQEQEEENSADDSTHDHAHLVGGCRRAEGGAGGGRG